MAGCNGAGGADRGAARARTVTATAVHDGSFMLRLPGGTVIAGQSGSVRGGTVVTARSERVAAPSSIGGVAVASNGPGVTVTVTDGSLKRPVMLRFAAPSVPAGSSVFAVHRDDAGRWTLLPSKYSANGSLSLETARFSIVTWVVGKILEPVGNFMAAKLAGRSSPPVCSGAPSWASVDPSPSGSTHACVRGGQPRSNGAAIAELEIKSNRGTYQWVQLPADLTPDYVWVEDQNDLARSLIRNAFGRGESVLIAPGGRMTIGYEQPSTPQQLKYRTYVDLVSGLTTIGRLALDAMTGDALDKTGGYVAVLSCIGSLHLDLTDTNNPLELTKPQLLTSLIPCVVNQIKSFADDPHRAVAAAASLLGQNANDTDLTTLSHGFYKLGRFAKILLKVAELGTYIFKELGFITDALTSGFGASNATTVTLTLAAASGNHQRSTTVRADGVGPITIGMDQASAIQRGHLTDGNQDSCTEEIDGTTDDADYAMPAPNGTTVRVFFRGGLVSSIYIQGRWTSWTGVNSGMSTEAAADQLTRAGFQVSVTGEDDSFGAGRIDASKNDGVQVMFGPPDGTDVVTEAALPAYSFCD